MNTSDYSQLHPCPCCSAGTIDSPGSYEVCGMCGWEDDPIQSRNPDYGGGANHESLRGARVRWQEQLQLECACIPYGVKNRAD